MALASTLMPQGSSQAIAAQKGVQAEGALSGRSEATDPHAMSLAQEASVLAKTGPASMMQQFKSNASEAMRATQETQTTAASMNTAATLTGLQPWNKNWVFQGGDKNPDLKSLLGSEPNRVQMAIDALQQRPSTLADLVGGEERGAVASPALSESLESKLLEGTGFGPGASEIDLNDASEPQATLAQRANPAAQSAAVSPEANLKGGLSLVSGSDFLQARGILQDSERKEVLGEAEAGAQALASGQRPGSAQASALGVTAQMGGTAVTGHVVKGAMAQDRLSSESVLGMSNQILRLNGSGGGEMRVRLKPDGLGELQLRVSTFGNQVGLRIQASDEKAKRILEESLGSLKDALAGQNLALGRVEVNVNSRAPEAAQYAAQEHLANDGNQTQAQNWGSQNPWQGQQQNSSSEGRSEWEPSPARGMPNRLTASLAQPAARQQGSGRLDVRA